MNSSETPGTVSAPLTANPAKADAARTLESTAQHTSVMSVLVGGVSSAQNAVLPAIAITFSAGSLGLLMAVPIAAVIIAVGTLFSYIRWKRLTYTIGAQDIRVESGLLSRSARSVPYERIQDVSLEQKLLPRMFGLVAVKFETGAGGGEDLSLAYLSEAVGEELRQLVRSRRDGAVASSSETGESVVTAEATAESAEPLFAMGPGRLFTFGLFEFSLAVFAVLGGLLQYADGFFGIEVWEMDLWRSVFEEQASTVSSLGRDAQIVTAITGIFGILLIGSATGMIRVFLREWGFLLERTARGFRRRRGLLTRTDVVMPIHRVQAIKIGTRLIQYRFGWHSLRFVSLAQDSGSANHVVAPFAKVREIAPIVETAGFRMPAGDADWHRASGKFLTDQLIAKSVFFAIIAIIVGALLIVLSPEFALPMLLILLGLAVFSAGAALYAWQFQRHALDETQIMARSGVLSPETQIATRLKLHSVEIAQGPISRLRGYATLHLGLAGGVFAIPGVPIERARDVRRKVIETIAATDFSQLESQTVMDPAL